MRKLALIAVAMGIPIAAYAADPVPLSYKTTAGRQSVVVTTGLDANGSPVVSAYKGSDGNWHDALVTAQTCGVDANGVPQACASSGSTDLSAYQTTTQSDAKYQSLSGKDAASGYPGLDASKLLLPAEIPFGTTAGTVADGGLLTSVQTTANAAIPSSRRGAANGVAGLDASSRLTNNIIGQINGLAAASLTDGTNMIAPVNTTTGTFNTISTSGSANFGVLSYTYPPGQSNSSTAIPTTAWVKTWVASAASPMTATVSAKTANYTLTAADCGQMITDIGSTAAFTITVPASVVATGCRIDIYQTTANTVTIAAGSGETLSAMSGALTLSGAGAHARIDTLSATLASVHP